MFRAFGKRDMTILYFLANLFLWALALIGTYYITDISGFHQLIITKLNLPQEAKLWIGGGVSFIIATFFSAPKFILMWGYMKGEIKIYGSSPD